MNNRPVNVDAPSGSADAKTLEVEQVSSRLSVPAGLVLPKGAAAKDVVPAPVDRAAADGLRVATDSWHIAVRFIPEVLQGGVDPLAFVRYLSTFGEMTGIRILDDALPSLEYFDPECCYLGYEIGFRTGFDKQRIESVFDFVRDGCTLRILPPRSLISDYVTLIQNLPETSNRLGEILVACGTLTPRELHDSLGLQADIAAESGRVPLLGKLLVEDKLVQPPVVEAALAKQIGGRNSK